MQQNYLAADLVRNQRFKKITSPQYLLEKLEKNKQRLRKRESRKKYEQRAKSFLLFVLPLLWPWFTLDDPRTFDAFFVGIVTAYMFAFVLFALISVFLFIVIDVSSCGLPEHMLVENWLRHQLTTKAEQGTTAKGVFIADYDANGLPNTLVQLFVGNQLVYKKSGWSVSQDGHIVAEDVDVPRVYNSDVFWLIPDPAKLAQ